MGSLGAAQPKNTMPRYSGAQIRCSNEHGGKPEPKNDAWTGGVGAAGPGESTSHLEEEYLKPGTGKTPPNWAMLPPNKITMPKKRAALPAHKEEPQSDGNDSDQETENLDGESLAPEKTPSPIGLSVRTPSPMRDPLQPEFPSMNVVEFGSIE